MPDVLYSRVARLRVNTVEVTGLRMAWRIQKNTKTSANTLEARVWNLSPTSRSAVQVRGAPMTLEAGYGNTLTVLFAGEVRLVQHAVEGADVVTVVESGDGDSALSRRRVAVSFKAGASYEEVAQTLVSHMGIDAGNLRKVLAREVAKRPRRALLSAWVAHGNASVELEMLLRGLGLTYSIQDGRLQVLAKTDAEAAPAVLLTPDTGLVGSPELVTPEDKKKAPFLKLRSLLNPMLRPGRYVHVESRGFKGQYVARDVLHTGDTHGGDWFTDVEATPA